MVESNLTGGDRPRPESRPVPELVSDVLATAHPLLERRAGVLHGWIDRVFTTEKMMTLSVETIDAVGSDVEAPTTDCDETVALPRVGQTVLLRFGPTPRASANARDLAWAQLKRGLHVEVTYSTSQRIFQDEKDTPFPEELRAHGCASPRVLVYTAAAVRPVAAA